MDWMFSYTVSSFILHFTNVSSYVDLFHFWLGLSCVGLDTVQRLNMDAIVYIIMSDKFEISHFNMPFGWARTQIETNQRIIINRKRISTTYNKCVCFFVRRTNDAQHTRRLAHLHEMGNQSGVCIAANGSFL